MILEGLDRMAIRNRIRNLINEYLNQNGQYPTLMIIDYRLYSTLMYEHINSLMDEDMPVFILIFDPVSYMGMEILQIDKMNYIRLVR